MNATPEGWYADPDDASRWRWWTRAFAVHDAADQGVARVLQSRSGGGLVDKETTWQVTISRPLERASDPLVLAACLGLDFIQILAFSER